MKSGIYRIINIKNNKIYIGSSKNIKYRITVHKRRLKLNNHINKHLQSSWNKYGSKNFKFEIITYLNLSILRRAEQFYINRYQSINPKFGYNNAVVISNAWDDIYKEKPIIKRLYFGCYNKEGKLVKVFRTNREIYSSFKIRKCTRIYEACDSNLTKTALGYYWIRLNVSKEKFQNKLVVKSRRGRHRKIHQCRLSDDSIIREWNSAVEAAKELNLSSFNITRSLRSTNYYKGYKWFYAAP